MFVRIKKLPLFWKLFSKPEKNVNFPGGQPIFPQLVMCFYPGGGGSTQLFSGRGVRPGFPKCGACELTFASEKGGLWAENFQIWGLVRWKFPNLGACELKFVWKLRLLRLKFQNFLKRGPCELTLLLKMGPLRAAGEAWKGGLQGRTSPYPLSRSVPPPGFLCTKKDQISLQTPTFPGKELPKFPIFPTMVIPEKMLSLSFHNVNYTEFCKVIDQLICP